MQQIRKIRQSEAMAKFQARPTMLLGATIFLAGVLLLTVDGLNVFYK